MSKKIYQDNGLPFWDWKDIEARDYIFSVLEGSVMQTLTKENRGWVFERIEAPSIIPSQFISEEYNVGDFFGVMTADPREVFERSFSLRPETTAASYEYCKHLFNHQQANPPICVYQLAKSFRNENDQVSKNMRLKEFYQLEFQCIYTENTNNNYQQAVVEPLMFAVAQLTGLEARIVPSDRTPSYSLRTLDIEVKTEYKWLEICSISLRNDVPFMWKDKELLNCEIAFGADRLVQVLNGTPTDV